MDPASAGFLFCFARRNYLLPDPSIFLGRRPLLYIALAGRVERTRC
jgi:hypothetical protein